MASPGPLEEEAEPQKLNRRCIYLHRLVGDDVRAPRTKSSRRTSWRVVLRFLVYGFIAIFTIRSRSNVYDLSEVNLGIYKAMSHRWFQTQPTFKYFDDIQTVADLKNWSRTAFLNQVSSDDPLTRPLSLLGFNRITALCGVCPEFAAVTISLRRAKLTTNYEDTTTSRFRKLATHAWTIRKIHPLDEFQSNDAEATDTMTSALDSSVKWAFTPMCSGQCECVDGQHEGYAGAGGYVAVLTIGSDGQQFVHLVDNVQASMADPALGICGGIRKTATITFDEFLESGFLDEQFAALTYEFLAYNPNLQVMSDVHTSFVGENVGIIVEKDIKAESLKLDIYNSVMRYFEIAYLVFTGCYFFEFCYRAYKYHPAFLYDVWSYVNLTSIVMSLTSLGLWLTYMPQLQTFLAQADFEHPMKFIQIHALSLWFLRCGSIATLTICLRILKFMGDLISRVRLLTRTISMAAKKIAIYVSYVLVIFFGFTFFAFIKFSATNKNFITVSSAFMSCFALLLGDTSSLPVADNAITVSFFVLFIICFYFVSVQMFNAIINYAYNLVSEQMEPEFEQEQRERRRNQMQQLAASRNFLRNFRDYTLAIFCRKTTEDPSAQKEAGEPEKKKGTENAERVQEKTHDKRKVPDSVCRILLFFIFAACYMWFLIVNLQIELSSDVREALISTIEGTPVNEYAVPGMITEISWDNMVSLSHVSSWLYGALPAIVFNSTSVESTLRAQQLGIHNPGTVCIQSWNCLVSARGYDDEVIAPSSAVGDGTAQLNNTNSSLVQSDLTPVRTWPPIQVDLPNFVRPPQNRSLVRITQRRAKVMANTGCTDPDTPADQCFTGGLTQVSNISNGTTNAQAMAPTRLPNNIIMPGSPVTTFEQVPSTDYRIMLGSSPVCKGTLNTGFRQTGGIVCMLDADYSTFLNQLSEMETRNFFTEGTTSLAIDFATYNGNRDLLTYVTIEFAVKPGGGIWRRVRISSMTLMYFNYFLDTYAQIVVRILPGILYICLVMKFAFDLHWDLRQEIYRKRLSENSGWIVASIEFFTLDVFNLLEAVSISISLLSFVLYILWLVKETDLDSMMQGDMNLLLDSLLDLMNQARLYNRLSAMNCLLIFIRPLKFVRQSVRFAQLYQTLWDALSDITWFVFMFAVTMLGCVMYAHVSFGPAFEPCRSLPSTINFLFNYVRGNFNYADLNRADPVMASFFFVPYLLSFSLVFLNIFFAIIDRYYSPKESPPLNIKRRLKPVFQRICRCIEWDEDYVMEQDPTEEKKLGPPSRQRKVHDLVQTINHTMTEHDHSAQLKSSKLLSDVCDTDERMGDVLHWSREEAGKFVMDFHRLLQKKQTVKNDEVFIKSDVMKTIRDESKVVREDMEESERLMRYATKVHEQMAMRDQETLARYILTLELKIRNRMKQRHELEREVRHLRSESDQMRFTREELSQQNGAVQVQASERWAAEDKDGGSEGSDEEPVPAIPGPPGEVAAAAPAAAATNGTDPGANRRMEKTNALLNLRS